MKAFEFGIYLDGVRDVDLTDDLLNRLYEAGCSDATISKKFGKIHLWFAREGNTRTEAVESALRDIDKVNPMFTEFHKLLVSPIAAAAIANCPELDLE